MKTIASLTIFCALVTSNIHAQYEYERYQRHHKQAESPQIQSEEEVRPKKPTVHDKRVLVQSVKGLIIAGEGKLPPDYVIRSTRGVEFYRSMQFVESTDREYLRKCLERQYLERVLTFEKLEDIKKEVAKFYRKHGQALVMVAIPEQDVSEGVVVITVLESRLGVVNILGNCWFCEERYRCYIRTCAGDVIYNREVEADVAWINRNNWRKVNAIYKPGKEIGTTDIDICVVDERPFNLYVGADNTGFKITDYNRIFLGFQWGNVFGLDHTLSYQAIGNPNWSKFWAQMVHYIAPLPWRHELVLFGGYSHTKAKNHFLPANVHDGKSYQISGRYVFPALPIQALLQDFKAGLDWKRTNNDLVIGKEVVSRTNATIIQLVGAWEARADWCDNTNHIRAEAEAFLQPWHFGQAMNHAAYNALRPGAALTYLYVKAFVHYLWQEPRTLMGFDFKMRAQITTAALLPIEMMGLGGVYSVRGYEERAVNVDNGLIFNFEVRTPKLAVCGRMKSFDCTDEGLAAIVFFDMGAGHIKKHVPGQPEDYFLAGIGPGIRYDWGRWLHARFDVGVRLTDSPFAATSHARVRLHWGVVAAY